MGLARRIAHLTYRSETELDLRFGRSPQEMKIPTVPTGRSHEVASPSSPYLIITQISSPDVSTPMIALTEAMSLFDVGRGRGGVASALNHSRTTHGRGIDSDRLFPLRLQSELVELTPGADELHVLRSPYGHDGFLVEDEQVGAFIHHAIERATSDQRGHPRPLSGRTHPQACCDGYPA